MNDNNANQKMLFCLIFVVHFIIVKWINYYYFRVHVLLMKILYSKQYWNFVPFFFSTVKRNNSRCYGELIYTALILTGVYYMGQHIINDHSHVSLQENAYRLAEGNVRVRSLLLLVEGRLYYLWSYYDASRLLETVDRRL